MRINSEVRSLPQEYAGRIYTISTTKIWARLPGVWVVDWKRSQDGYSLSFAFKIRDCSLYSSVLTMPLELDEKDVFRWMIWLRKRLDPCKIQRFF